MMKKLGMFAFVMALVVVFALPAFAYTVEGAKGERFTMGGEFNTEIGYRGTDKAYNTYASTLNNGAVDRSQFYLTVPWSVLRGSFVMGDLSANWVLAFESQVMSNYKEDPATQVDSLQYNNIIDVVYGSYKFGNSLFQAGKMNSHFTTWLTSQTVGYSTSTGTHTNSIGYGAFYDNKYPQLRWTQTFTKEVAFQFSLVTTGTYQADPSYGGTQTKLSYAQYPMIAGKLMLNFGNVMVFPAVVWQQVNWDTLPNGWDNSMIAWAVNLPARIAFGPFVGIVTVGYGKNSGGATGTFRVTTDQTFSGFQRNSVTGKIYDTTNYNGIIDLAYTFGPVTPHVFFSLTNSQNDKYKIVNGKTDNATRTSMGINAFYKVNNVLTIIPEFAMYDLGEFVNAPYATLGNVPAFGKDWIAGVQFKFAF
jgi:hypothetical protein